MNKEHGEDALENNLPDADLVAEPASVDDDLAALKAEVENDFEPDEVKRFGGEAVPTDGSGPLP